MSALPLLLAALGGVGVTENLGQKVPADVELVDVHGDQVKLGSLLDGKTPVVIAPVYFGCPANVFGSFEGMRRAQGNGLHARSERTSSFRSHERLLIVGDSARPTS